MNSSLLATDPIEQVIRLAYLASLRAGPITEALKPLSPSELEAPIAVELLDLPDGEPKADGLSICGYRIISEIGSGGQATVYDAIQETTGQRVAIKVIPGGRFIASRHRARFDREAGLLASFDHPNIVRMTDRGRTTDGSSYLAMRFIDGCNLDEYAAAQRKHGDIRSILQIFVKIADAVEEAHRRNIVHRDLKPSNIRVDHYGEPQILDFGLACVTDTFWLDNSQMQRALTMPGQIVGSLPWASPEQINNGVVDGRSDVYSLGVLLYEVITGKSPYPTGGTVRDLLENIAQTVPQRPSRHPCGVLLCNPESIDSIILRALSKSPNDRYTTAGKLGLDLQRYLEGHSVSARAPSRRWRRAIVASTAIALLATSVVTALAIRSPATAPIVTVIELPSISNTLGMRLICIPPGHFDMGSSNADSLRNPDEALHVVTLTHAFYIGSCEVTQHQFDEVMGKNRTSTTSPRNLPATYVTWTQATEFCKRLSQREGQHYRLPTEAEWEYACRAGLPEKFGGTGRLADMGWYAGNSGSTLHAIQQLKPNHFDLYDMNGGVGEWCSDGYDTETIRPQIDPVGSLTSTDHVVRGGSYLEPIENCRSASRLPAPPNLSAPDIGFRIVMDPLSSHR